MKYQNKKVCDGYPPSTKSITRATYIECRFSVRTCLRKSLKFALDSYLLNILYSLNNYYRSFAGRRF